jgi:hypothetical protein
MKIDYCIQVNMKHNNISIRGNKDIKLPLFLPGMLAWEVEVYFHSFLTLALDSNKW